MIYVRILLMLYSFKKQMPDVKENDEMRNPHGGTEHVRAYIRHIEGVEYDGPIKRTLRTRNRSHGTSIEMKIV